MGPIDGMEAMKTESAQVEPIQASWKISDVIARYPALVDELASLNPTFRLLRNPVARRVQARLVTVAQAARVAGMEAEVLVSALNAAIGCATQPAANATAGSRPSGESSRPSWVGESRIGAEIDAHRLQREGIEPFGAIMAAARQVRPGEVLRLRSSFEPVPLYDVMAQRGFERSTRQVAEDDWEIQFLNSGHKVEGAIPTAAPPAATGSRNWDSPTATLTIDVSDLVPPEPLIRIMEALEELPSGASLLVHHVRRPVHLYPQLEQSGYRHQTRDVAPGKVEILIEKPASGQ